jgi:hypothetical protein
MAHSAAEGNRSWVIGYRRKKSHHPLPMTYNPINRRFDELELCAWRFAANAVSWCGSINIFLLKTVIYSDISDLTKKANWENNE